jgi:hypothetical protein
MTARAVRSGSRTLLGAGAAFLDGVEMSLETRSVALDGTRLDLELGVGLLDPNGDPLRFVERDGRLLWAPPASMEARGELEPADLDVTDSLSEATVSVLLRHRPTAALYEHHVPWSLERVAGGVAASGHVVTSVDLATAAAGGPLSRGIWDLYVNVAVAGFARRRKAPGGDPGPLDTADAASAYVTDAGNLALRVRRSDAADLVVGPPVPEVEGSAAPAAIRRTLGSMLPAPARRAARAIVRTFRA